MTVHFQSRNSKNDTTEIVNGYVTVFPNPTKEEIWIKTENKRKMPMQVYNYVGQYII